MTRRPSRIWGVAVAVWIAVSPATRADTPPPVHRGTTPITLPQSSLPQSSLPQWPVQPWSGPVELSPDGPTDGLSGIIRRLLLDSLPESYEDKRKWGGTARRWDGLHVHREGLHVKTKRRWKEVNHGLWQMYRIVPRQPDQNLRLQIVNLRESSPGVAMFDIHFRAPMDAFARRSRWNYGVQLYSLSLDAEATIDLHTQVELRTKLDARTFPPELQLQPRVTSAQLRLTEFRVDKISKIGGDVAEEMGEALEKLLVKKLEEQQQKIIDRMNRQLERKQDKLRIGFHELVDWLPDPEP